MELSPEGNRLWGRIGGDTLGKDLDISLEDNGAFGRLGGKTIGDNLAFQRNRETGDITFPRKVLTYIRATKL